jgi:hypothetical protein
VTIERRVEAAWKRARPLLALTMIFAAAALVLGPLVLWLLIVRGVREGHPSWVALGVLCGLPPLLIVVSLVRRALRGKRGGDAPPGSGDV